MSITLIIIIATCGISLMAFFNEKVFDDLIFYPPAITERKQYYRFFTCGLIHANYGHLFFNMYSLYMFGEYVESQFENVFGANGKWLYLLMYVSALAVCLLPTYNKNKHNSNYRSLGASGAVSAVVFAFMFLEPLRKIGIIFIPVMIPGFMFGFIYLVVSSILDRRGGGNINHSAHIWGALYGIGFLIVTGNFLSRYHLLESFLRQVQSYFGSF
ncbi:MAG: rhomboid family intramembrane serine protease [Bacteroidota bacterium]|nr:rhomboid family intramembrane serine protease [Bacteroidota bacterium]